MKKVIKGIVLLVLVFSLGVISYAAQEDLPRVQSITPGTPILFELE